MISHGVATRSMQAGLLHTASRWSFPQASSWTECRQGNPPAPKPGVLAGVPPKSDPVAPPPNSDGVEAAEAAGVDAPKRLGVPAPPPNRLGVDAAAGAAPNRLGVDAGVPNRDGAADAPAGVPKSDGADAVAGVPKSDGVALDVAGVVAPPQENAGVDGVASAMAACDQSARCDVSLAAADFQILPKSRQRRSCMTLDA